MQFEAIRSQIGFYPLEFHSGLNRIQIGFDLPTTYTLLPTHYYRRQFLLPTRCYLLCLPTTCSLLPVTYYLGQLLVLLWTCSRSLLRTAYVAEGERMILVSERTTDGRTSEYGAVNWKD